MQGSMLCLLLISGVAATKLQGEPDLFYKAAKTNVLRRENFPGCDGIYCTSMRKALTDVHRRKRAFPALFKVAWAKLVATTYGFRWMQFYGEKVKHFVKVGTTDDALKDFYSLSPTEVRRESYGLVGQVGNQDVLLMPPPSPGRPPVLQLMGPRGPSVRQITYAEKTHEAQTFLQNIQKSADEIQKMINPTLR